MEHIYVNNFGEGRKSGGALTTGATASLAPLHISYVSTLDDVLKLIFPYHKKLFLFNCILLTIEFINLSIGSIYLKNSGTSNHLFTTQNRS